MSTNPIPEDYRATPYLICKNASEALNWYSRAFNAKEIVRLADDSGKVMHAEIRIGFSPIMLADEFMDMGYKSPDTIGGSPVLILVYVENIDETYARAIKLGAKKITDVADQFDGDRRGNLVDPYGHVWILASRQENISNSDMKLRFEKIMKSES